MCFVSQHGPARDAAALSGLLGPHPHSQHHRGLWSPGMLLSLFKRSISPFETFDYYPHYHDQVHCWPYYYFTFFLAHLLAMTSTCTNPILYGRING